MASFFTHAAVAATLVKIGSSGSNKVNSRNYLLCAAILSCFPDLDVIAYYLGVPYESFWGHRGISHSLFMAIFLGFLTNYFLLLKSDKPFSLMWWKSGMLLSVITASHGVIDALTNGGHGIAFFSPFDNTRYFFPWRPLEVSPMGISFFGPRGVKAVFSEVVWIWVPCAIMLTVLFVYRRITQAHSE